VTVKIERLVVGIDGSDNARQAAQWAADLAAITDADVIAVHAVGLLDRLESGDPVPSYPHRQEIELAFKTSWCSPFDTAGVRYRAELRDGNPVVVLLTVADEVDADLLVVGSRGVGGFPQLLLGSISTQVAQHAHRPVVIVPSGNRLV
jgi:nucleotide-binding universal stress UspA family protein